MGAVSALSMRVDRMDRLLADWRLGVRSGPLLRRQRGGGHVAACHQREKVVRAAVRAGEGGQSEGSYSVDDITSSFVCLALRDKGK